jgi:hypothetical protein
MSSVIEKSLNSLSSDPDDKVEGIKLRLPSVAPVDLNKKKKKNDCC